MRIPERAAGDVVPPSGDSGELPSLLDQFRDGVPQAVEELFRRLGPITRRIATEVTHGWDGWERDDFIDRALTELLAPRPHAVARILLFDPKVGPLEGWLATTLRNLWRSTCRRRVPPTASLPADHAAPEERLEFAEAENALGLPFSDADLRRIDVWKPRERVELLALSGLFVKVPPDTWERFLAECGRVLKRTLARPFPPEEVLAGDDPAARTRPLAAALGVRPNTLSQRWKRGKERLDGLDFVRQLRDAAK